MCGSKEPISVCHKTAIPFILMHRYRQFKVWTYLKTMFKVKGYISLHYVHIDNSQIAKYFTKV